MTPKMSSRARFVQGSLGEAGKAWRSRKSGPTVIPADLSDEALAKLEAGIQFFKEFHYINHSIVDWISRSNRVSKPASISLSVSPR
jgi:hypothetical protein